MNKNIDMNKISKIKLISEDYTGDFNKRVNRKLKMGWTLYAYDMDKKKATVVKYEKTLI